MARIILGILLLLSILSWAIIFQKWFQLAGIERKTARFLDLFRAGNGLPNPKSFRNSAGKTPLVTVYDAGYAELSAQLEMVKADDAKLPASKLKNPSAVGVEMQIAAGEEVRRLETGMSSLATIASVSPFIGLFGTVWGVMDSFAGLGDAGAASLRAVAPGISEALVTTAAGLFAAIPALIAYNYYLRDIRNVSGRMDSFATEFVSKIETLYTS